MKIKLVKLEVGDTVVFAFGNEMNMDQVEKMTAEVKRTLGRRVNVVPLVGFAMVSVIRSILPNVE